MTLLRDERVIDRLDRCGVILTTHRIREETGRDFTSIMLEQVCSIAIERVASTWLLVVGVALIVATTIGAEYHRVDLEAALQIAAAGFVLILSYFLSCYRVVQIASASARISVRLPRRKQRAESILRFIDAIEFAKSERMTVFADTRWERAS